MSTEAKPPSQKSSKVSRVPKKPDGLPITAPDRLITLWEKFANKVIAYFSRALLIAIGAILVFTAAWGIGQWMDMRREHATDLLGKAIKVSEAELLKEGEQPDSDAEVPRFKTAAERADATMKALDELDGKYGSSAPALRGVLLRAGVHYDMARYSDAEAAYKKFLYSKPRDSALVALAHEGVGLCAEARGDNNAALASFTVQAEHPFARERALWNQARIQEKLGNKQKALEIYKDLLAKSSPTSPLRDDLQNRIAALES